MIRSSTLLSLSSALFASLGYSIPVPEVLQCGRFQIVTENNVCGCVGPPWGHLIMNADGSDCVCPGNDPHYNPFNTMSCSCDTGYTWHSGGCKPQPSCIGSSWYDYGWNKCQCNDPYAIATETAPGSNTFDCTSCQMGFNLYSPGSCMAVCSEDDSVPDPQNKYLCVCTLDQNTVPGLVGDHFECNECKEGYVRVNAGEPCREKAICHPPLLTRDAATNTCICAEDENATNESDCSQCKTGYTKVSGICQVIKVCDKTGQELDTEINLCKCTDQNASIESECDNCKDGFSHVEGTCVETVQCTRIGQQRDPSTNTCVCIDGNASFETDCVSCKPGFVIAGGVGRCQATKECAAPLELDSENNVCKCIDSNASLESNCATCNAGSVNIGDTCQPITQCTAPGQELDSETNICKCTDINASLESSCATCKTGYTRDADGKCTTSSNPGTDDNCDDEYAEYTNGACICKTGYKKDEYTGRCVIIPSGEDNYEPSTGGSETYNGGSPSYGGSGNGGSPSYGGSESYDNSNDCPSEAPYSKSRKACVCTCNNSLYEASSRSCVCRPGYTRKGSNCVKDTNNSSYDTKPSYDDKTDTSKKTEYEEPTKVDNVEF